MDPETKDRVWLEQTLEITLSDLVVLLGIIKRRMPMKAWTKLTELEHEAIERAEQVSDDREENLP